MNYPANNHLSSYDEARRDSALSHQPLSPLEVANFVEGMTSELRLMARSAKLDTLSYFLEMARIEASAQIEQIAERELDT